MGDMGLINVGAEALIVAGVEELLRQSDSRYFRSGGKSATLFCETGTSLESLAVSRLLLE